MLRLVNHKEEKQNPHECQFQYYYSRHLSSGWLYSIIVVIVMSGGCGFVVVVAVAEAAVLAAIVVVVVVVVLVAVWVAPAEGVWEANVARAVVVVIEVVSQQRRSSSRGQHHQLSKETAVVPFRL